MTLPPREGEDAGKVQTIGARFAHGEMTLEEAAELGCRACASPGGGCQFLGTAATSQVVAEALGHGAAALGPRPLGPADLARHGPALGPGPGRPGAPRADDRATSSPTPPIRNAMVVHAAFGGSTNLLLHIPAIAYAAGLPPARPSTTGTRSTARCRGSSSVLPNGPLDHPTVRVFLAGGVPEVMLHLRGPGPARRDGPDRDRRAAGPGRSTGGRPASAGRGSATGCSSRTASTPTT